ncbi:winged helix-turn-helix transcriptional regulator [Mucilaginibacter robiniae]|uniref:Winged helix-turn-helix transcriptional regulator n=1 Tax=Mucilaginibacter robiniae TaxID=2728022 RepID=A0A7L5E5S6_9SPHI|nr:winged helix-turn-helix transcriptional regulator [Mucilaginibacter robiniae]
MPTVTEMTLSLQLKQLEEDGMVSRKVYGDKPPVKVIYSFTDLGKFFIPVLDAVPHGVINFCKARQSPLHKFTSPVSTGLDGLFRRYTITAEK